jgi:hypothetical protein
MKINLPEHLLSGLRGCVLEAYTDSEFALQSELQQLAKYFLDILRSDPLEPVTSGPIFLTQTCLDTNYWEIELSPLAFTTFFRSVHHVVEDIVRHVILDWECPIRLNVNFEEFQILCDKTNKILQYLPLGTVVLLKVGVKKLIVFGRHQQDTANNRIFDYAGVPYPEGNINPKSTFLFNADSITDVLYFGYTDQEEAAWLDKLHALENTDGPTTDHPDPTPPAETQTGESAS